ncbi:MAG: Spy0128 family protein, partial [Muribaculaceae bacterium]
MNKKLLALLLAILMVAVSACAMAATLDSATLYKVYTTNSANAVNPAETFTLKYKENTAKVEAGQATSAPAVPASWVTGLTVSFDAGDADVTGSTSTDMVKSFASIELPTVTQPGIYSYQFNEIAGNTTGVTYDTATITMKIGAETVAT